MNTIQFSEFVKDKEQKFKGSGHDFDTSDLCQKFIPHFGENYRIKVINKEYGEIHSGYVGITTGWKPAFLLVYNRRCYGSSILLDDSYEITRIYKEDRYAI